LYSSVVVFNQEWEALGSMFTTKDDVVTKNTSRGEMVTPSYTGNIPGDPRGGRTRLLTNNICTGTNYYLGVQGNGSRFLDRKGKFVVNFVTTHGSCF
jgi:hypothetical protein